MGSMYKICSKLVIKTPDQCYWRCSGAFIFDFEQFSYIFLVFPILALNKQIPAWYHVNYWFKSLQSTAAAKNKSNERIENIRLMWWMYSKLKMRTPERNQVLLFWFHYCWLWTHSEYNSRHEYSVFINNFGEIISKIFVSSLSHFTYKFI